MKDAAPKLIQAGRYLFSEGWSPATSSNYSLRYSLGTQPQAVLMTVSGRHKGQLKEADFIVTDLAGQVLERQAETDQPSAEAALHLQIYNHFPDIGAVLHTHSVNATVLSRIYATTQWIEFSGYEIQKAFSGEITHDKTLLVPIVENSQDMAALAAQVKPILDVTGTTPGYLIRGHGLYTWGSDIDVALRHVEAFEFLFQCRLAELSVAAQLPKS